MEKAKILEQLIKESGFNLRSFAEKCNIPYTSLYTMIKKTGIGKANVEVVIKMCKELGITVEQLDEMSKGFIEEEVKPSYENIKSLVARNGKYLTPEQKQDIIKALLSDD